MKLSGQRLGSHRFAGAGRADEESATVRRLAVLAKPAPLMLLAHQFIQSSAKHLIEYHVLERVAGLSMFNQPF